MCCVCGLCTLPFVRACFLCGIKTSLPLRKNFFVVQDAYLKLRQRKRRRTIGKWLDRNAVGTLDGISGTFRRQVNQTGKEARHLSISCTQTIQNVFQKYTLTPAHTMNTHCNFSTPHSLNLLPAVPLSQINLASKGCTRAPFCLKCVLAG